MGDVGQRRQQLEQALLVAQQAVANNPHDGPAQQAATGAGAALARFDRANAGALQAAGLVGGAGAELAELGAAEELEAAQADGEGAAVEALGLLAAKVGVLCS